MRLACVKQIKNSELGLNLCTFYFNNNRSTYNTFLNNLLENNGAIDTSLNCVEALARALYRPVLVISALEQHKKDPILHFNSKIDSKPPLIFGVQTRKDKQIIFRPYYIDKQDSFSLNKVKKRFEIVLFHSRSMPELRSYEHISVHELLALLNSLYALKGILGLSPLKVITDSRALYLLFHRQVQTSSTKLVRWSLKLLTDWPQISLIFCKSQDNIADFLSRNYDINKADVPRIGLQKYEINNLDNVVPDNVSFSLEEWRQWVMDNPSHLHIIDKAPKSLVSSLRLSNAQNEKIGGLIASTSLSILGKNIGTHLLPFQELDSRLSYDNIVKIQSSELQHWKNAPTNSMVYKEAYGAFSIWP